MTILQRHIIEGHGQGAREMHMISTAIPRALRQQIRVFCVEHGIPMRQFVEDALRAKLSRSGSGDGGDGGGRPPTRAA